MLFKVDIYFKTRIKCSNKRKMIQYYKLHGNPIRGATKSQY